MTSVTSREGLLSRRLAAGSSRMERLLGLSSHYSFASAAENHEDLREEDVWLAGGADEDFGDEKKKTRSYFQLSDDFGDQKKKTKNDFHLHEDFGDERKKMMSYFHFQDDFGDEKKMMNYFHLQEDLGDEKKKAKNYFHLQEDSIDEKKMKKYFHSGKNSANIVKLNDGLGISGLSVAFDDPALRSRDVSFVISSRAIPRVETLDAEEKGIIYQSAPVNVPDWTKILGIHHRNAVDRNILTVDDDDADDDERLPPHEYLAREHAKSHVDATAVLEGVGRKLKGRDLSRVRNAVWNQTGFLG